MCDGDSPAPMTPGERLALTGETLLERLEALAARLDVLALELAVAMAAAGREGSRFEPVRLKLEELLAECTETAAEAAALAGGERSPAPERYVG